MALGSGLLQEPGTTWDTVTSASKLKPAMVMTLATSAALKSECPSVVVLTGTPIRLRVGTYDPKHPMLPALYRKLPKD
jgi:hypothetical protein